MCRARACVGSDSPPEDDPPAPVEEDGQDDPVDEVPPGDTVVEEEEEEEPWGALATVIDAAREDHDIRSSIDDLARFLAAMSNEGQLGSAEVLSSTSAEQMLAPQFPAVDAGQFVFWYEMDVADRAVLGHNGGDQGVATEMVFSPESGVGVIVLMNTNWGSTGDAAGIIQRALFDAAEANEGRR